MTFGKRRNLKDIENTLTSSLWLGHILERRDEADATELPKLVFPRAFMCACVPACVRLCARLCACVPACGCARGFVCVRACVRATNVPSQGRRVRFSTAEPAGLKARMVLAGVTF